MKNADAEYVKPGIYDIKCPWDTRRIRIIVLSRISKEKKNAIWHLFSAKPDLIELGASEYQWRTPISSIMNELFQKYNMEGVITMPYTMTDYMRNYVKNYFPVLPPDERDEFLKSIPVEERLKGISADKRLKGISADKRLKGISTNEIVKKITNVEVIKRMTKAERKKILELLHEHEDS